MKKAMTRKISGLCFALSVVLASNANASSCGDSLGVKKKDKFVESVLWNIDRVGPQDPNYSTAETIPLNGYITLDAWLESNVLENADVPDAIILNNFCRQRVNDRYSNLNDGYVYSCSRAYITSWEPAHAYGVEKYATAAIDVLRRRSDDTGSAIGNKCNVLQHAELRLMSALPTCGQNFVDGQNNLLNQLSSKLGCTSL